MTRLALFFLAAAVSMTGAGLYADGGMPNVSGSDAKMSGEHLQQLGATIADEKTVRDIHALLAKVGNDALTENSFSMLLGHLSKADRDRIGDFKNQKLDDLNRCVSQFRTDFKAKYHQDFDLRPEFFKDAMVYAGQDKNSATVSLSEMSFLGKGGDKMMDTGAKTSDAQTTATVVETGKGDPAKDSSASALGNRTNPKSEGENSNTVVRGGEPMPVDVIPDSVKKDSTRTQAMTTKPIAGATLTLNLVNEGGLMSAWKINIPDQITGEQLRGNLLKHIQMLDDQKATWPTDASGAYHAAAFHVLSALNDSSLATER